MTQLLQGALVDLCFPACHLHLPCTTRPATTRRLALRSALGTKRPLSSLSYFLFRSFGLRSICLVGLHFVARSGLRQSESLHQFDRRGVERYSELHVRRQRRLLFSIGGSYMRMASETKRQNVVNKTPVALPNQLVAPTVSLETALIGALSGAIGAR